MSLGWVASLRNSARGLRDAARRERPVRQEIAALALAVALAPLLARSAAHGLVLVGAVLVTLVVELLNAAIETVCDRITTERDDHVRLAKDYGSAAVTLSILLGLSVWAEAAWAALVR